MTARWVLYGFYDFAKHAALNLGYVPRIVLHKMLNAEIFPYRSICNLILTKIMLYEILLISYISITFGIDKTNLT